MSLICQVTKTHNIGENNYRMSIMQEYKSVTCRYVRTVVIEILLILF